MGHIDIERIIRDSDYSVLKKLPRFVIWGLKKIIYEKELNRILEKYSDLEGYDFLVRMIDEFNLKLEVTGKENLPDSSKCIFAANHPYGIIDGLAITHTVAGKYGRLNAIGNDAFIFIPPLKPFIFAVNVFGTNSKDRIMALDDLYASDMPITHFPAGAVSRIYSGKVQDGEWYKSFVSKAISHNRMIVPIHFIGRNSRLFYFVSSIRKMLGIKLTIELILLPHEMFNKRGRTIRAVIGKPIPPEMLDKRYTHQEWTRLIRQHVYQLGDSSKNPVKEFSDL